jgi:hypothetical protein
VDSFPAKGSSELASALSAMTAMVNSLKIKRK